MIQHSCFCCGHAAAAAAAAAAANFGLLPANFTLIRACLQTDYVIPYIDPWATKLCSNHIKIGSPKRH